MLQNTFLQSIKITNVSKEEPFSLYLKLKLQTGDIKRIKVEIDKFTHAHLSKVVFPEYAKHVSENSFCSIPINSQNNNCQSEVDWVILNLFGQTGRFSFLCSKEYKLFLNRLRGVGSLNELNEILEYREELPELRRSPLLPKTSFRWRALLKNATLIVFVIFSVFLVPSTDLLGDQKDTVLLNESLIEMPDIADEKYKEYETIPVAEIESGKKDISVKAMINSLPEGQIALTFDDGPSHYTEDILAVLGEYGIKGTFFFVGQNIKRFPQSVSDAGEQGHGIGLHSFSHQVLKGLSIEKQEEDTDFCIKAIKPYIDKVTLFRPPYGMYDDHTKEMLLAHNMTMVLWNRDPKDWKADSSQQIADAVLGPKNLSPSGGIYVLHENARTLKALPQIIKAIQEKNLEFVIPGNDNM